MKKIFFGILLLLLSFNLNVPTVFASYDLVWLNKTDLPESNYSLRAVAATNGKIYAIGGHTDAGIVGAVEEYDPSTDTWTTKTSMPTPRQAFGLTLGSNGKIYAIGGQTTDGSIVGAVEEYDPSTDTWTTKTSMPTPRVGLGASTGNNGKIYAIGGVVAPSVIVSTVEEYDPTSDSWTTKSSMPIQKYSFGQVTANSGKIYIVGGQSGTCPCVGVAEYNPDTDSWTTRNNAPTSRTGVSLVKDTSGRIYAIGGNQSGIPLRTVEVYDENTDTWQSKAILNVGRMDFGATTGSNGKIYIVGGFGYDMQNWPNLAALSSLEEASINEAPVVDIIPDSNINTGDIFSKNGSFSDFDSTSWTAYVDYGEGAGYEPLILNPDKTFALNHQYNTPNQYNVVVLVRDDKSAEGYANTTVTVSDPTPTPTLTPTIVPTDTPTPTPVPTYAISGNVYVDANENGFQDTGEVNYEGAAIALTGDATGTDTTDENGIYSFPSLTTGSYTVTATAPTGYSLTTTNPVTIPVTTDSTINFGIAPVPTETVLSPTADTFIKAGSQNENEGASTLMRLQASGHNRGLIKFNQSQIQQAVSGVQNYTATLELTITDNGENWGTGREIGIHRLVQDWVEGNGFIVGNSPTFRGTGSGTTWNCATDTNIANFNDDCTGSTVWNMSNSALWPFISTPTATTIITNGQSGIVTFDVTSDVQAFVNGTNNNQGWLIKKGNEGQNGRVEFGTKESTSQPRLIINTQ